MTAEPRATAGWCTCAEPIVVIKAERKGAARRLCARCGLGVKVAF